MRSAKAEFVKQNFAEVNDKVEISSATRLTSLLLVGLFRCLIYLLTTMSVQVFLRPCMLQRPCKPCMIPAGARFRQLVIDVHPCSVGPSSPNPIIGVSCELTRPGLELQT